MAFRSEREADRHRIDALEDAVEDKDEEIARLRAQLEAKEKKPAPKKRQKKQPKGNVPEVDDLPDGDVMEIATHDPTLNIIGAVWLAVVLGMLGYAWATSVFEMQMLVPALIFGVPPIFFLMRGKLVCDRKAGTITVVHSLVVSVKRKLSVEGQTLVVERRMHKPKDGDSYWAGHLFIGDRRIAHKKIHPAMAMARRVAAFMRMPLADRHQSQKDIMKAANMPLVIVVVVMAIAVLGYMTLGMPGP